MMFGRRALGSRKWIGVAAIAALLLFIGILIVNIAGQGYERQSFTASNFDAANTAKFPAHFFGGSLRNEPGCEPYLIRQGDVFRTSHQMFEYKVILVGSEDLPYENDTLHGCFVEEILVQNTRDLAVVLPPQFGFFPKAQILISCEQPNVTLWTEYTYVNTDPVGKAQEDSMPFADITQQPASYWAQAVVVYWWDMLSVNLTQANEANFNSTLQSVLLQALYPNNTEASIEIDSTITTTIFESNESTPKSFTRQPSAPFSAGQQQLLDQLQISNSSAEFLEAIYWAVNLDLGQNSSQNIFLHSDLLAESTDIFHDNVFINFTFQNTPLSDGRIPGNGYRSVENISEPLTQTPATLNIHYQCWRWVGKPGLLALIDVLVPTLVLFTFFLSLFFFGYKAWHGRNRPPTDREFLLVPRDPPPTDDPRRSRIRSFQEFDAITPEGQYLVPRSEQEHEQPERTPSPEIDLNPGPSGPRNYAPIPEEDEVDPFQDPAEHLRPHFLEQTQAARQSPGVRTIASETSILETPVSLTANLENYRISEETAQVFEIHAERMRGMQRESTIREPASWNSRLSQRRSSTDLKRMNVMK